MNAQPSPASVPLLDLAPKLRRPLHPLNPLDYLRLLYWVFFFPQAIRWYLETFARPESRKAIGVDLLPALRQDPVARNLVLMALLVPILIPLSLAAALQGTGVPVSWFDVGGIVAFGVGIFALNTVGISIAFGVVFSVVFSVAFGMLMLVGGVEFETVVIYGFLVGLLVGFSVGFGVESGVAVWMVFPVGILVFLAVFGTVVFGVVLFVAVNKVFCLCSTVVLLVMLVVAGIVTLGRVFKSVGCLIIPALPAMVLLAFGLALDDVEGMPGGIALSDLVLITLALLSLRLPDYLVGMLPTLWIWSRRGGALPHVTPLPLPGVQRRLEAWLQADWAAGVHNVNQVLAYSLQFIPAVRAVNRVLAQMPEERLIPAVAELARKPYDWKLVYFGSASLRNALINKAAEGAMLKRSAGYHWQKAWEEGFPVELSLDTPAQAVCAGFWYLHEKQLREAAEAFRLVQRLPYGAEMASLASALAQALAAIDSRDVAAWAKEATSLLPILQNEAGIASPLNSDTLSVLRQLQKAAGEVHTACQPISWLLRSLAVARAVDTLTYLIDSGTEVCEGPVGELVREVAAHWRDILTNWNLEIENPFEEGAVGRPARQTFVGRGEVLAQLERWWSGPPDALLPVLILYGQRRIGKSSILSHLLEKHPSHLLVAYINMRYLSPLNYIADLIIQLVKVIHRAAAPTLKAGSRPRVAKDATFGEAMVALNRLLERLAPQMAGRRLILMLDTYEPVQKEIEQDQFYPDLLRYLAVVLIRHRWVNLILAGRPRLVEKRDHYQTFFYSSVETVRVTFLKREEAVALIRRPTDDFALDIEAPLAEEIYRLTHGQPYLLQRLCYELVESWNKRLRQEGRDIPRRLTVTDLRALLTTKFLRKFFLIADDYFSEVWEEAGPDGQRILRALARWEEGTAVGREEVVRAAGLEPAAGEAALHTLLEHDLVVKAEGGIRLAVPLMHTWLRMEESSEGG